MSTRAEHYKAAEDLIELAQGSINRLNDNNGITEYQERRNHVRLQATIALAQVHATLAGSLITPDREEAELATGRTE